MMDFLSHLDVVTLLFLNGFAGHTSVGDSAIIAVAHYLPYAVVLIFAVVLARAQVSVREKVTIAAASILSVFLARGVITEGIRFLYHRPRPFLVHDVVQLLPETSYSFPSGHATFFFALAAALYFYNKRWGMWFGVAAIGIGIARVMSGVHYPSDIIGGALIGILSAWASVICVRMFRTASIPTKE